MKDLIINIFGEYVPNSYSVTLPDNGGYDTIIPDGIAGVDITWVAGFVLFALFMYCCFRLIGRK